MNCGMRMEHPSRSTAEDVRQLRREDRQLCKCADPAGCQVPVTGSVCRRDLHCDICGDPPSAVLKGSGNRLHNATTVCDNCLEDLRQLNKEAGL